MTTYELSAESRCDVNSCANHCRCKCKRGYECDEVRYKPRERRSCIPLVEPRSLTYYNVDCACPKHLQCGCYRRKVTIPYSAVDGTGCCMPGYRDMVCDKGYKLIYNDYPFFSINMSNSLWPLYTTQKPQK